ncbi:MAG: hypothetical protein C4520_00290 [Candidatus Abyssobacteria bacterium SURF_5]|uniref:Cytochrome b/b6 C-terminal region profile domain-containing protein n=1 Tax=Abyssobacteria bacterium (strain SURF_5) TaxID=2093360 RepID=A0A3A4P1U0_ABYX5|nr:MAG: hypothetical protein C4520_00290 [Candidatus Abyssubacteria bacterium SURF_5]
MDLSVKAGSAEVAQDEFEFVIPHLVMKEFIAAIIASVILLVWSMLQNAPLLSIADPNKTENPAKAPWYFVGLQELLVYFDPWIAGVVIPTLIILGLVLIPYIDVSTTAIGKYSFSERRAAIITYVFGFGMWFVLILIGQFLRGPNWQFYWLWEDWSVAKSAEETLVNMPQWAGIAFLATYITIGLALPAVLMKGIFRRMGAVRYLIAFTLVLLMYGVPIKILLRLAFNIRYIVTTPWFNI